MKVAHAHLKSISQYSQSKPYLVDKKDKESHKDFEERTWRERCHYNPDGQMFIPPMQFKKAIETAVKFLNIKIPGGAGGKATYTKHFLGGTMVTDPLPLDTKKDDVPGEWLFVPSNGQRGGSTRVYKCFPVIAAWEGEVTFYVLDDIITEEVFEKVIREAGNFIGIGRFRPEKGGFYGRFSVESIRWE